jgi:NADH-quinone oxidoreductase subunit B
VALVDRLGKALTSAPILLTSVDALADWALGQSLWAMPMGTACCAMELIAASFSKFDFDRLGTFPRPDPRHTDVMVVAGTVTRKMAPAVKRLYEQMAEPRYVVAMGNCAISGGIFFYDTYSVVHGVDEFLPVDVYIAGRRAQLRQADAAPRSERRAGGYDRSGGASIDPDRPGARSRGR